MKLLFGTAQDARVPEPGASGAIAAVLGATSSSIQARGVLTAQLFARARQAAPRSNGAPGRSATTEVRNGLVSGIVNTDIYNQY